MTEEPSTTEPQTTRLRVGSIVIRCFEWQRMRDFWLAALGYQIRYAAPPGDNFVIIEDPAGAGPNLSIDEAPVKRSGKRSWIHLDLMTEDQAGEVERLTGLGAKRYPWRYPDGADYVVLEDPDGNLFCVVDESASDDAPA